MFDSPHLQHVWTSYSFMHCEGICRRCLSLLKSWRRFFGAACVSLAAGGWVAEKRCQSLDDVDVAITQSRNVWSSICSVQLKFHGSSFLVASSWHPREVALTRHKEIGRVGRVGREYYEDTSDLSATSRACRARGIWRTTRHTDKRAALYTAADRRPTNQVSA